jgi:hypothetical protein
MGLFVCMPEEGAVPLVTIKSKFVTPDIKGVDEEKGVLTAVVSTEHVDRDGDIIRQADWDLSHFRAHPALISSHNYHGLTNQIGHWTSMEIQGKQLVGEAKYYIGEGNPEADWGFKLATKGQAAFSVGFMPDMAKAKQLQTDGKLSYEFRGQELLEVSQVIVPSNREALQTLKGLGLYPEVDALIGRILDDYKWEDIVVPQVKGADCDCDTNSNITIIDGQTFASSLGGIIRESIADETAALKEFLIEQFKVKESAVKEIYPEAASIVRDAMREYLEGGR